MDQMTYRVDKLYRFIVDFTTKNGYAPTLREMGAGIGVNSTSLIRMYRDKLVEDGKIKVTPEIARGVVVL